MSVTKHARIVNSPKLVGSLFSVHLYCKFVRCSLISRCPRKNYRQGLILTLKKNYYLFLFIKNKNNNDTECEIRNWNSFEFHILYHCWIMLNQLFYRVCTQAWEQEGLLDKITFVVDENRRWKYSLLLLRLVRLNYGWCVIGLGKRRRRGGGGRGEEGGRNTLSQVGTITQKSGFWMQLFEIHFAPAPPPHLNLQLGFQGSLQIFKSLRQGENPGNNTQPFLLLNSYFTNLYCQLFTTLIRPS